MRDVLKAGMGRSLRALKQEDKLAAAWVVACGRMMAEHGTVVGYAAGTVEVEVSAGAWFEHMKVMRGELMAQLARIAGVPVTEIHFVLKR